MKAVADNIIVEMVGYKHLDRLIETLDKSSRTQQLYGVVRSIGGLAQDIKVDDVVIIRLDSGYAYRVDDKEYRRMPAKDVIAVIDDVETGKKVKQI